MNRNSTHHVSLIDILRQYAVENTYLLGKHKQQHIPDERVREEGGGGRGETHARKEQNTTTATLCLCHYERPDYRKKTPRLCLENHAHG